VAGKGCFLAEVEGWKDVRKGMIGGMERVCICNRMEAKNPHLGLIEKTLHIYSRGIGLAKVFVSLFRIFKCYLPFLRSD